APPVEAVPPPLVTSSVLALPPFPPAAGGVSTSATSLQCNATALIASSSDDRTKEQEVRRIAMTQNSSATPLVAKNSAPETPVTISPPSDAENERSGAPAPNVVTDRNEPARPNDNARPPRPNSASEFVFVPWAPVMGSGTNQTSAPRSATSA